MFDFTQWKKGLRLALWIILEFFKKNYPFLTISFFLSLATILAIYSSSNSFAFFSKRLIIGYGRYFTFNSLPDEILAKISNGLFYLSPEGELVPILVSRWERSADGQSFRFFLKKNLVWSDGKPFSAYDIDYQFKDVSMKVFDDYTVEFNLRKPLPIFPYYLTKPLIRYPLVGVGGNYQVLKILTVKGRIREIRLKPIMTGDRPITYKFFPTETDLIVAYKKGDVTYFRTNNILVAKQFMSWKNTKVEKIVNYNSVVTLMFNLNNSKIADKMARTAINFAINRDSFKDFGEPALVPFNPATKYFNKNLKKPVYEVEKAKEILSQLEITTNSAALRLLTPFEMLSLAEILEDLLSQVNLRIQIITPRDDQSQNSFDLFLTKIDIPFDSDQYYYWHSQSQNQKIFGYKNDRVDFFIEQGRSTLNSAKRIENYQKLQEALLVDPPAIFIVYPYTFNVSRR